MDAAHKIVAIRADAETQARVDELADRANEGRLSEKERAEYDSYLAWFHMITILQARAAQSCEIRQRREMDAALRQLVWHRAGDRGEYCRLPQAAAPALTFHVEHIRARQHRGGDEPSHLALACPDCNRHKGPNLSAIDPQTLRVVSLFHPREHTWNEHFTMEGARIQGISAAGRATVELLDMNNDERVAMRAELQDAGEM